MKKQRMRLAGIAAALCLAAGVVQTSFGAYGPGMDPQEMGQAEETGKNEEAEGLKETGKAESDKTIREETQTATEAEGGTRNNETARQAAGSFEVERFVLPEDARVLVIVEGTGGSGCSVYAYEYEPEAGETGRWALRLSTPGYLGRNGMSNHRTEGDKTTPIGVFQMNTPFGQAAPLPGFPDSYIQVGESHVWSDKQNRLADDAAERGERVGTAGYSEYYDYVIDAGFNRNAIEKKGSALFLHCIGHGRTETSGCVAIDKGQMVEIMKLYGKYGDGHTYIAQAPQGTFELVYASYGVNRGLSPEGDFQ